MQESILDRSTAPAIGQAPAPDAERALAISIGEWTYPPLDLGETAEMPFREGRPLILCPHGHVRDQGDYCSACDL